MSQLRSYIVSLFVLFAIPAIVFCGCSSSEVNEGWKIDYSRPFYTSTSSIIRSKTSSICPSLLFDPSMFLLPTGPLGYLGPLGPRGPLGKWGPIGYNVWNPSTSMKSIGDWSSFSQNLTEMGGPLSGKGPLGASGPVSPAQYYGRANPGKQLFQGNNFAVQLRGFGLWGSLGPLGPLGALGPLGPLGPLGAHGFTVDEDGNYLSNGSIIRTVSVPHDNETSHAFELFENYEEDYAKEKFDQDTSFMVEGSSSRVKEIDYFPFRSSSDQVVSIVIAPVYDLTDYSLGIYDDEGDLIATSETTGYVEAIQMAVPAGRSLTVAVKLAASGLFFPYTAQYRLYVTGSTSRLNQNNIQGDHILEWYDNHHAKGDFAATLN